MFGNSNIIYVPSGEAPAALAPSPVADPPPSPIALTMLVIAPPSYERYFPVLGDMKS
jgi:hypothetical protein